MSNLCTIDTSDNEVVVIILPEKLTMANSQQIQNELRLAGHTGKTVLDFGATQFCDSSGLAILVKYYKSLDTDNEHVILANLNERIKSLLELTRLHELFIITDNVFNAKRILIESKHDI